MNVAITLLQGPFVQYQVYEKGVIILAMVRYAKYTVRDAFMQFKQQQQRRRRYLPQQKQSYSGVTS
ncbi:hypothetical protein SPB21_07130 [Leptothoe sp. ISB3NOV94-8A]